MTSSSVVAVFDNLDLALELYQRLSFPNQMKFSRVNEFLKNVFEIYIWNVNYRTMNILEKGNELMVSNETEMNRLSLKNDGLRQLFDCYAHTVERLHVKNIILEADDYGRIAPHGQIIKRKQLNLKQFTNLKSLTYDCIAVPPEHLRLIGKLLPDLEELSFINSLEESDIGLLLQEVLPHMRKLKMLCVQEPDSVCVENRKRFPLSYHQFVELTSNGTLETLKFNTAILVPEDILPSEAADNSRLRELHIHTVFAPQDWGCNFRSYLNKFETLTTLVVEVWEGVIDETLLTIAVNCKNLKKLDIKYSIFNIEQFVVPKTLQELVLHSCYGLTYNHLQQILTTLPITKFVSSLTSYKGEFTTFCVSPLIQWLNVDDVLTNNFLLINVPNTLVDLTWYDSWQEEAFSLSGCNNLQQLDIKTGHLDLNSLLELRSLERLILPYPMPLQTWSYITNVLGHPTIKDLTIRKYCNYPSLYNLMVEDIPSSTITTNLNVLEIPLDLFDLAPGFWLDVYSHNKKIERLTISFCADDRYDLSLENLLNHRKFPRSQKWLDVCGFNINCDRVRRNPLQKFRDVQKLRRVTENTNDIFRIILRKKYIKKIKT